MNIIEGFLKKIDLYGVKVDLQIGAQKKFNTAVGGFFSLMQLVLALFLFIALGADMMERANPSVVVSEIYNSSPSKTVISKSDYFFMLGMQLPVTFAQFYDESLYNISLYLDYSDNVNYANSARIRIPIEKCTEDHVPPELLTNFRNMVLADFGTMACIKSDYDGNFSMEGAYDAPLFTRIQLYITPCENSSEVQTCKPQEEIDSALESGFFTLYSTDTIVDLRDFASPGKKITRDYYIPTAYGLTKQITRYLSSSHISSDEGWIVNDVKTLNYAVYNNDKESFEIYDRNSNHTKTLVDMVIRKSNYEKIYQRQYKKIQNVFAEMGGFINISFLFFSVLVMPYVTNGFLESMINKLFNFQIDESERSGGRKIGKNAQKNKKKLETLKTMLNEIKSETIPGVVKYSNRRKSTIDDQVFELKEAPLNLGLWQKIKNWFLKNDQTAEKLQQRKVGINSFLDKLDITFLLNKFQEIEKLKILLLNEDQYHLFDFFPKPLIMKNGKILLNCANPFDKEPSSPKKKKEIVSNLETRHKAKVIKEAYQRVRHKPDPSGIDEKLLELIDGELKILFGNEIPSAQDEDFEKDEKATKRDALIELEIKSNISEGMDNIPSRLEKYTKE